MERQATEVGRYGSGVWLERRSLAWSQVPCAEQWSTVWGNPTDSVWKSIFDGAAWPLLGVPRFVPFVHRLAGRKEPSALDFKIARIVGYMGVFFGSIALIQILFTH